MFPRANFVLLCFVMTIASSHGKGQTSSRQPNNAALRQPGQNFVVNNNCGLAKTDREMIAYIKAKVDYIAAQAGKVSACSTGWVPYGKSCYLVIDIPTLKWTDARRNCQKLGADLVKITSAGENKFVFDLISKQKTITREGIWLGFHLKTDGKYYWADDTPLAGYIVWSPGEPSSPSTEKCGNMYALPSDSNKGKWNDLRCSLDKSWLVYAPVILCQKTSK